MRALSSLLLAASLALTACHARGPAAPPAHHPDPIATPIHRPDPIARPAIDRAALKAKLAARRQANFERFIAYREARVYPLSPGPGRQHIWIDASGRLCAAATMISADWGKDATVAAVEGNLAIRIADLTSGALADWMLTSGMIQQELVAIQVPGFEMRPEPQRPEVAIMYPLYVEVERQITSQWDANLDLAVDRLMAKPALAKAFLAGALPTPA
ncbi:MAG: hypothetical protein JNK64_31570 [Myxococcales bacterium]|nr:hypothetical protein [Myxococcales bacterium]